jgi:hypothetical protein
MKNEGRSEGQEKQGEEEWKRTDIEDGKMDRGQGRRERKVKDMRR